MSETRKLKEVVRRASVPLYDFVTIELVLTNDVFASQDKRGIPKKKQGEAITIPNGNTFTVIMPETTPANHVTHEAVHVATYTLTAAGVKASLSNDEPIAYIADWFGGWVAGQREKIAKAQKKT